jgi:hypothetical protein
MGRVGKSRATWGVEGGRTSHEKREVRKGGNRGGSHTGREDA